MLILWVFLRLAGCFAHHEVLEEPGAHDVGGMFGQDPPLVLGLLVLAIKEGGEIQVHLIGERIG